jgi:PAS domain-containing protein
VAPEIGRIIEPLCLEVMRTGLPILDRVIQVPIAIEGHRQRHYRCSYYPLQQGDYILGVSVVVEDVNGDKLAEDQLRSSERYRTLFETTTDGLLIVNDEGRYIDVNDS